MKRKTTIFISLLLVILTSCNSYKKLNGIYILRPIVEDGLPKNNTLFEFKNDSVYIVSIGDRATGNLSGLKILKTTYEYTESYLTFESEGKKDFKLKVSIKDGRIYLFNKKINQKEVEFIKLDSSLTNTSIEDVCFKGSYYIQGKVYKDSIDFINDSLLIYTGISNINFPAKKWEIIKYNGLNILNIHNDIHQIIFIKSCSENNIILEYPFSNDMSFTLTKSHSKIDKSNLIGVWDEIKTPITKPLPPSQYLKEGDQYYKLIIQSDTLKSHYLGRINKLSWNLTNDGNRLYFTDYLNNYRDERFSWKIINLKNNELTLRISSSGGFEEEIIKLKRKTD